jgi:hypothetical protein
MKPIDHLFTEIARDHLGIETLETRKRDSLDLHDVSVWGVKDALLAAYQAGVNDLTARPDAGRFQEMRETLDRLAYDADGDQNNPLIRDKTLESVARARGMLANSPPVETAMDMPIIAIHVEGGLIEDLEATLSIHAVVEDWDVADYDTGKRPARTVWKLEGGMSASKAAKLRRVIAND